MKKIIIPTILLAIITIFSVVILLKNKNNDPIVLNSPSPSEIIFFYGDGCPHCLIVEEYFKANDIESKISFAKKEVYRNLANQKELIEKAKICGFKENEIGVPLLWDNEKCLIGDRDIIDFFNQKINEK